MKKKSKKPIFHLIEGTVFPFDTLIAICSDEELYKYIEGEKKYKLNDEEKEKLCLRGRGKTTILRGGQIVIRLHLEKTKIGIDIAVLAHEIAHAAFLLMERIGVEHTNASDEVFAYYQQYLMNRVLSYFDE